MYELMMFSDWAVGFLNIPTDVLIDYFWLGFTLNVISLIITVVFAGIKASNFDEDDIEKFSRFSDLHLKTVKETPTRKKFIRMLLVFMPMYSVWLNSFFLYYIIKYKGFHGYIKGFIVRDRMSLVPLIISNPKNK